MATLSPKTKKAAQNLALDIRIASDNGENILRFLFRVLGDDQEATGYRLQAAQMLLNRGYGREQVEINVTHDDEPELRRYTIEELQQIERSMNAIEAASTVVEGTDA
jgi:hypothetical protein